jgi:hypothetical protein
MSWWVRSKGLKGVLVEHHVEQKMQKENALSSQDGRGRGYQHRDLSVVR